MAGSFPHFRALWGGEMLKGFRASDKAVCVFVPISKNN